MDTTIIAAIIGALIPIAIGAITWVFKNKIFNYPAKKRLINEKLTHVYAPLAAIFETKHNVTNNEVHNKLSEIINNHHPLIAPVMVEWHSLQIHNDQVFDRSCNLFLHIQSNYNWLKKKLGYDYQNEKILPEYLPNYKDVKSTILSIDITVTFVIPCIYVVQLVLTSTANEPKQVWSQQDAITFIFWGIFYVTWLLARTFYKLVHRWNVKLL